VDEELGPLEKAVGPDRRAFLKGLVIGGAFAVPVVSSFTMSGMQSVFAATPGSTTIATVPNTLPPTPLNNFPTEVACFTVTPTGLDVTTTDGAVQLHLVVPAGALPTGSSVCIYRANLAAFDSVVPSGQTPVSGYGVVWSIPLPPGGAPNAASPITLTVTDPAVSNAAPIYAVDKTTGALTGGGTASGDTWIVAFVVDPGFIVTAVPTAAAAPTTATFTG